uniref:Uncharacterized protein n=1 Tax=Rhizophora mucronata TaxID=61149 RepID=A0A2P2J5N3_RHIMU
MPSSVLSKKLVVMINFHLPFAPKKFIFTGNGNNFSKPTILQYQYFIFFYSDHNFTVEKWLVKISDALIIIIGCY